MARTGRPAFQPTEYQRGQVSAMVVAGYPEEKISEVLDISRTTLRKHFHEELEHARLRIHTEISTFIVNTIIGRDSKNRLTSEPARASLAQFYAARQMGWKDTTVHEHKGTEDGPAIKHDVRVRNFELIRSVARRMARATAGESPAVDHEGDDHGGS